MSKNKVVKTLTSIPAKMIKNVFDILKTLIGKDTEIHIGKVVYMNIVFTDITIKRETVKIGNEVKTPKP